MASALPTSEYTIRVMTIEDHAAVKEIAAATWKGHVHDYDYVIDAFPHWLNTTESVPLALQDQDAKILAFTNVRFIDEGKTAWIEGTRVHPDHRKKNLGTTLLEHCKHVAQERKAKFYRYSTGSDNYGSIRMAEKLQLKNADYHHCVFLNMEQSQRFAALLEISEADREFERVTATDLFTLLQSHPIFSKHKYFIAGWSVYLPQLDSLLSEEKKGAEFYVNKRADPNEPISTYTYGKKVEIISCSRGDSTAKWVIGIRSINADLLYRSIATQYYIAKEKDCALVDVKFDTEFGEEFHNKIQGPVEKFGMYVFEADL